MENFYTDVIENTKSNLHKKKEKEQQKSKEMDDNLESAIELLYNEVLESFKSKVETASNDGLNTCCIYTYNIDELVGEYHKKNFLFRGPVYDIGNGKFNNYFVNKGVKSLMTRLKEHISPFKIILKYNRTKRENNVHIVW